MEIPMIVEPFSGGWRARCRHPVEASATGDTRYEATQALEAILRAALAAPFTLLPLEVTPDKPWIASAASSSRREMRGCCAESKRLSAAVVKRLLSSSMNVEWTVGN